MAKKKKKKKNRSALITHTCQISFADNTPLALTQHIMKYIYTIWDW